MGWSGVRIPYIPPRGGSPTRRLFQPLQPYLTPKRFARYMLGVENGVTTIPSHSEPYVKVSLHTAPGVDTLFCPRSRINRPAFYFDVQSYMQHVVFQLVLAIILLLTAVSISTP
ncbi:hypothetical protein N39L_52280 [Limnospira platensis NIES-39]|nr:hypothetical protein N39L_52280 [Arthrospira platensis NIES-39]